MLASGRFLINTFVGRIRTLPASTNVRSFSTEPQSASEEDDSPMELETNPYERQPRKCLLCKTGVELDYKNARLLQQFVSSFSGRVYDRHITGLCDHQQNKLVETIAVSRKAGYMPILVKDPKYTRDPKLFDPLKPIRPHSFASSVGSHHTLAFIAVNYSDITEYCPPQKSVRHFPQNNTASLD